MEDNQDLTEQSLLDLLVKEEKSFGSTYYPLHRGKLEGVIRATNLVQQDAQAIHRNTIKKRAHTILTDIWIHLPEVFILCSISITPTLLGTLKSQTYLPKISDWWKQNDHPTSLKETVTQLSTILPAREPQPGLAILRAVSAPKRKKASEARPYPDKRIVQPEIKEPSSIDKFPESNSITPNLSPGDSGHTQLQKSSFSPNVARSPSQQPKLSPNNRPTYSQPTPIAQPISIFTGDVYELTIEDIRAVTMSGQVSGKIWLTDTYGAKTTSFITIPVTNELTLQLVMERRRIM